MPASESRSRSLGLLARDAETRDRANDMPVGHRDEGLDDNHAWAQSYSVRVCAAARWQDSALILESE